MTDTPRMSLPLLAPAQAQKHVTVNEALARIDALTHLTLASVSLTVPPVSAPEGTIHAVPPGAVNAWAGHEGRLAIAVAGGWVFVPPRRGWRALVLDTGAPAIWDGTDWQMGAVTLSPSGSALALRSFEFDFLITSGTTLTTPFAIPARALVFGVTGRVITTITGGATSWRLGVAGSTTRFGNGLGVAQNSWVSGPVAPIVYWAPTSLVLTATGGNFAEGLVRLVVHYADLTLPAPV